jgi:hypothetical protein
MTYGLANDDRELVAAFMQGVRRTAPLKFDHPGLGTTAARSGGVVVIQNDIGTTDAHVVVIRVDNLTVTTLYSDVHLQRLNFFAALFSRWEVRWDDILSRRDGAMDDGLYHLAVARHDAGDRAGLLDFLSFLGSRLVFLIDWNKARKRLRSLLGKADAADLLKWAADEDIGHMGFLKCGGDELIYRGLALAAKGDYRPGLFLHDVLPRNLARQFMQFVFRAASLGLREGKQILLIEDEVVVELSRFFRGAEERLLDMAAEHAALAWEVAAGLRDCLLRARLSDWQHHFGHNAERAKAWESQADELVQAARLAMHRSEPAAFIAQLIEAADEVVDCLEDAAFLLTTLPVESNGELCQQLETLARLVLAAAQEYVKVVATARSGRDPRVARGHAGPACRRAPHRRPRASVRRRRASGGSRAGCPCRQLPRTLRARRDRQEPRTGSGRADARRPEIPRPRTERSRCTLGERSWQQHPYRRDRCSCSVARWPRRDPAASTKWVSRPST